MYDENGKEIQEQKSNGGSDMDNGFGTQDIITGRGLWIGGFGYGNYGRTFANEASIQHGLGYNRQETENQADCTRGILTSNIASVDKSLENLERTNSFNRICDKITEQNNTTGQYMLQLTRELADARAESAACCCETQKEILRLDASNNLKFAELGKDICNVESRLASQIASVEARNVERQLNATQAELTALKTQVACGCTTGCSRPCPPCGS